MNFLELATLLLSLASIFSIINLRLLKLPQTIGLMVLAIILSAVVLVMGLINPDFLTFATSLTQQFDFSVLLIDVMLPFLLFAGAISVDFFLAVIWTFFPCVFCQFHFWLRAL